MTVAIEMGRTTAGAPATLDLEELLATRLLVQGNSGSGKSHLLRRLLEQSAPWVQQTIIDPEGDFVALADRFGHLSLPQIRPEHIGDAAHPGSDGTECVPLPRRHVISARLVQR
jgi:DNA helicase HerA-like ATPase